MNDWMCKRFTWDDSYRPDRGKVLGADGAREGREASRAISTWTATASRRARYPGVHPRGGVFHARLGSHKHGDVHRGLGRVSGGRRPAGAEVRDGGERGAGAGDPSAERQRHVGVDRNHLDRRLPRRGARGGRPAARAGHRRSTTCASGRSRSRRACASSSSRTSGAIVVEQNRDAQLRSLLAIETGVARDSMISMLDYGGLPLTADRVVAGVISRREAPRGTVESAVRCRTAKRARWTLRTIT